MKDDILIMCRGYKPDNYADRSGCFSTIPSTVSTTIEAYVLLYDKTSQGIRASSDASPSVARVLITTGAVIRASPYFIEWASTDSAVLKWLAQQNSSSGGHRLSSEMLALAITIPILVLILLIFAIYFLMRHRKRTLRRRERSSS